MIFVKDQIGIEYLQFNYNYKSFAHNVM